MGPKQNLSDKIKQLGLPEGTEKTFSKTAWDYLEKQIHPKEKIFELVLETAWPFAAEFVDSSTGCRLWPRKKGEWDPARHESQNEITVLVRDIMLRMIENRRKSKKDNPKKGKRLRRQPGESLHENIRHQAFERLVERNDTIAHQDDNPTSTAQNSEPGSSTLETRRAENSHHMENPTTPGPSKVRTVLSNPPHGKYVGPA